MRYYNFKVFIKYYKIMIAKYISHTEIFIQNLFDCARTIKMFRSCDNEECTSSCSTHSNSICWKRIQRDVIDSVGDRVFALSIRSILSGKCQTA